MKLESGLLPRIVVQRNGRDKSNARFGGTCKASGDVLARVTQKGKAMRGFAAVKVGKAARGRFEGTLKGLPTGGPYDVELSIAGSGESARVPGVLVGDVWLLGGQSNMQGCGKRHTADKPHPMVRAFIMTDKWTTAKDPIHNLWNAIDPVHGGSPEGRDSGDGGVGPGVAFGKRMHELTGVPQGLIACAHGGTSMSQWDPALKSKGGDSLYGASIRRLNKNGRNIAGIVWYQGESDAGEAAAAVYTERMKTLVRSFRRDAGDAKLPFVMVQISRVIGEMFPSKWWGMIQDQQRLLPSVIRHTATVPAIDLPLDDLIHIGGEGNRILGGRLADAMEQLRRGTRAGRPQIALKHISMSVSGTTGQADIVAEFDHVTGKLVAGSRPTGFTVADEHKPAVCVYDVKLDGKRAIIRTNQGPGYFGDKLLYYGYGNDPVCNITDEAGRSLPVFGPVHITRPRALTPFVKNLQISRIQPDAGKLRKLSLPRNRKALGLKQHRFTDELLNINHMFVNNDRSGVAYFVSSYICSEAMKLAVCLGYDGPVKMWLDGKQIYHDPAGTNPAVADQAIVKVPGRKGKHELVIALGANGGNAWGIELRLERLDVPLPLLRKGPAHYVLPQWR